MSNIWKRSLSLLLAVVMVVGMVPMSVFATEQEECAHVNVEYIDEPADCVWEGYYAEYCLDCDTYLHEELIPANGHSWEGDVCTACGETLAVEEPEEEPAEESMEENTDEELVVVPMEDPAELAMKSAELTGVVFLDKNRQSALESKIIGGGLRNMVLTAVGMDGASTKVYYEHGGKKYNVADLFDLYELGDVLADQLTGSTTMEFLVGNQTAAIQLLNINNLQFNVTVPTVKHVGDPGADLAAMVHDALELENAQIQVTYGDKVIDWNALADQQYDITYNKPGNYTWPALTKSKKTDASLTITIYDSVDGKTMKSGSANVYLQDITPTNAVSFYSEGVAYRNFSVIEHKDLPYVADPTRSYYVFKGWTDDVSASEYPVKLVGKDLVYVIDEETTAPVTTVTVKKTDITDPASYYAVWLPMQDNNNDGIADQQQRFNVVYLVDGNHYTTISHKFGEATKLPEAPVDETGLNRTFYGWAPIDNLSKENVGVASIVQKDATYGAVWTYTTVVEYNVYAYNEKTGEYELTQYKNITQDIGANGKAENKVIEKVYLENDTWYDVNGNPFNFDAPVTDDMLVNGRLYLEARLDGEDIGGVEGKKDGTKDDPYTDFVFQQYQRDENGEWGWIEKTSKREYDKDSSTKVDISKIDLPNDEGDYVTYVGWIEESVGGKEFAAKKTYVADAVENFNNNSIADALEKAKLDLPVGIKPEAPENLGMPERIPENAVEKFGIDAIPNLTEYGEVDTGEGVIKITGLQADGTFVWNRDVTGLVDENNAETYLEVEPHGGYYVKEISIGGNPLDLKVGRDSGVFEYDEEKSSYKINLSDLNTGVAMMAAEDDTAVANPVIKIEFESSVIVFKEDVKLEAGKTYNEKELYEALVSEPAYENGDKITIEYVARAEQKNVELDISALREDIVYRYGKLGEMVLDKVNLSNMTKTLDWDIRAFNAGYTGMVKNYQQVTDSWILDMQDVGIADLLDENKQGAIFGNLYTALDEQANINPFLYQTGEVTILVKNSRDGQNFGGTPVTPGIVNKDGFAETTVTVVDNRATSTIKGAGYKEFYAGTYGEDDLKDGIYVEENPDAQVELMDNYVGRNARTYKATVYYAGDADHKPAQKTFTLKINKNKASVTVDNVIVKKHDDIYNADPKVKIWNAEEKTWIPADADDVSLISVVAGLDLNELDLDLSKGNPYANLKNIKAKAWIKLPGDLKSALENYAGEDLSQTYQASEVKELLQEYRDLLAGHGFTHEAIEKVLALLTKIEDFGIYNYADASLGMDIVFTDNAYPENPGVYVNMAVTVDPAYETAYNYGTIVIAPVAALPNRNGLQLKYDGQAENLFTIPSDGNAKALEVWYKDSRLVNAPVYYYGLTAELSIYSDTVAPSLPGIYLASAIHSTGNSVELIPGDTESVVSTLKDLASDSALMIIGMETVNLEVKSDLKVYDGETAFKPEIIVTDRNGDVVTDAAVTVISGTVENDNDLSLDDLGASINVAFPEAVHAAWNIFADQLNNQDYVELTVNDELQEIQISAETFAKFVNWCDNRVEGIEGRYEVYSNALRAKLIDAGIPAKYIDEIKGYFDTVVPHLQNVAAKVTAKAVIAAQKGEIKAGEKTVKLTFGKDISYTKAGVYLYYGIVTDPQYVATPNAGIMIIKAPDEAMVLLDTVVPYDGNSHKPVGWDNINRDGITFVVDRKANTVNFLLDNNMKAVVDAFEEKTAKRLNGLKVSTLFEKYEDGKTYADEFVAKVCEKIKAKVLDRLGEKLGSIVTSLPADEEARLNAVQAALNERLNELNKDATIYIDAALPKNAGDYEFYAYSYAIEVAYAKLTIEPIHVRVSIPEDQKKVYDGTDKVTFEPVVTYFSYKQVEGGERIEVPIDEDELPAGVSYTDLNLSYTVSSSGVNVGTYPVTITNASVKYDTEKKPVLANFSTVVDRKHGEWEITVRPITVVVSPVKDNYKYYGDVDPEYVCKIDPTDAVAAKDGLTFTATRKNTGQAADEYAITVKETYANYDITVVESTLTILPAEIKVTIESVEKQFDATEDPEFEYSIDIEKGLSAKNLEELIGFTLEKFIENLKITVMSDGNEGGINNLGKQYALYAQHVNNDADATNNNANVIITANEDAIMEITLGDYICWNTETKVYYNDVTDALQKAEPGQTVQMLKDATDKIDQKDEETIIVYNGLTFDLNGFYVETDNLLSFGVVMDSLSGTDSVVNDDGLVSGGILIDVDTKNAWTQLQTENGGYMPIYDTVTGSYKFFAGNVQSSGALAVGTNEVQFWYKILTDEAEGYLVLHRTEDSNMKSVLNMNWTGMSGFGITYTMNDDTVKTYAGNAYNAVITNGHNNQGLFLRVTGIQKLGSNAVITCEPTVKTDAEFAADADRVLTHIVK